MKEETKPEELGACPKCGSKDRQSGRMMAAEHVTPLKFEADTVRFVSDSGPVRAVVCNQCRYLELYVF